MDEWDFEANQALDPKRLTRGSNKKVSWICSKCRHQWKAKICNRANLKRGCPVCANKVVAEGKNDLGTTHPQLAEEWHSEKNGDLTPKSITYGSGKKAWWLCPEGHEYQATILHRSRGTNCPNCNSGRQTSFAEQATFFYVKKLYPDAISRYQSEFLGVMELDIFIPSINYAIEYDGEAWHKQSKIKREQTKYKRCQEQGIKLIRLREKYAELGSNVADYQFGVERLYEPKNLEPVIKQILKRLNFSNTWLFKCPIDVNIERDRYEILRNYKIALKKDSLSAKFPQIAEQWHPTKNKNLSPEMFKPMSDHKAWWKCPTCDHEYKTTIGHRVYGTGCPICAIEKVTSVKRKPVKMVDPNTGKTISTFISISDAARKMNINNSNITMVCKGTRAKAGGYFWAYV